jgi:hypothetical protein
VTRSAIVSGFILAQLSSGVVQAQDCGRLEDFGFDGVNVDIQGTAHVDELAGAPAGPGGADAATPAHCRVDGILDERIGVDGVTYGIRFALALPDDWNGRFLFQGGGGLNGSVQNPVGGVAAGGRSALMRGFAVVSTDTGHQGGGFDSSFMADQQAALDFFYAANTKLTPVAKAMITAHYGREIDYSYFTGCSTGGREGMIMSQRNPGFFDGIVSGAPAMRTGHSNLTLAYINSAFSEFAPRDENGVASPGDLLSDNDVTLVMDSLLAACDANDGVADGMIFNTQACAFEPASLVCSGPKTDGCLSEGQVRGLEQAFQGPVDSMGRQVYPPFPWDSGLDARRGLPGILVSGGTSPVQGQRTTGAFDVDAEASAVAGDVLGRMGDSNLPNLSTFIENGSKILFYHGMSDPWFSGHETTRYYESLAAANGGADAVPEFSRLFLVPGMGHCGGGAMALDQFDLLTAIVDWVERGEAPDRVVSTGAAVPGRSRPLCPYPTYAHYTGGDVELASSFECQAGP